MQRKIRPSLKSLIIKHEIFNNNDNNLEKDDYIELLEMENATHKFYVFKANKAE